MNDVKRAEWAELIEQARLSAKMYHECLPHLRIDVSLLLAVNKELEALRARVAELENNQPTFAELLRNAAEEKEANRNG